MEIIKNECNCPKCISCCKSIPGMALPQEIITIANHLKLSIKDTLEKHFIRGYRDFDIYKNGKDIHINIAYPAKKGFENVREDWGYPLVGGECTFLKNDLCTIHKVKPFECKMVFGCKPLKSNPRTLVLKEWDKANKNGSIHKEIKTFLGI